MHVPVLIAQPEMLGPVMLGTPRWVWFLLAGLLYMGAAQLRDRRVRMFRVAALPIVMTLLSVSGIVSAFGAAPVFGYLMLTWMLVAATAFAAIGMSAPPEGTRYDRDSGTFFLPGSWVPLATVAAVFVTRYIVNVDVAVQPAAIHDTAYTLVVAALYGLFTGTFLGRAARLVRVANEGRAFGLSLQRDPW